MYLRFIQFMRNYEKRVIILRISWVDIENLCPIIILILYDMYYNILVRFFFNTAL